MLKSKTAFILVILGLLLLVFYLEWDVLPPFIMGGVFAYILYPFASFLSRRLKLTWKLAASIVYFSLLGAFIWGLSLVGAKLAEELTDLARGTPAFLLTLEDQMAFLPESIQPQVRSLVETVRFSLQSFPSKIIPYFPGAFSKLVSVLMFLVASFYILLDGRDGISRFLTLLNKSDRDEVMMVLERINRVVNSYLRGQLFLAFIMAVLSFILLTIFGIKYALVLAIIIGLAELVPYVGPLIAGVVAAVVAFFDPGSSFEMLSIYKSAIVALGYVVLNQLENLIIVPQVVKVTTNIHPMIAMFAVLAGGNSFGIMGIILAIPIVSAAKIVLEYWLEKTLQKS